MITIHQRYRQTDRQTDRQTTCDRNTALCTKVHRAVIILTDTLQHLKGSHHAAHSHTPALEMVTPYCNMVCFGVCSALSVCKTVHRLNSNDGHSLLVNKFCVPPSQCTMQHVGCKSLFYSTSTMVCHFLCTLTIAYLCISQILFSIVILNNSFWTAFTDLEHVLN